jgi:hypothetical protein
MPGRPGRTKPGQPVRPRTDPKHVPPTPLQVLRERHVCAECFGPRSRIRAKNGHLFCAVCERALFGDDRSGQDSFIRSERARRAQAIRFGRRP